MTRCGNSSFHLSALIAKVRPGQVTRFQLKRSSKRSLVQPLSSLLPCLPLLVCSLAVAARFACLRQYLSLNWMHIQRRLRNNSLTSLALMIGSDQTRPKSCEKNFSAPILQNHSIAFQFRVSAELNHSVNSSPHSWSSRVHSTSK